MEKSYFGVMLDCSRNAVMKPEKVKDFAKTIKALGYNMIQLYTEDTFEVDGEPYFGYLRGRYTKEELKDMVSYCNSIGVEMIPCIQTLAHLNAIFRWRPYQSINDTADILLIDDERTYQLIDNMFKTLRECFTTDTIHIGMDEAYMVGLGKYLEKHGYENRFKLLRSHLEKVIEIAKKYSFKPIMWADMFFFLANGDKFFNKKNMSSEQKEYVPDGVELVYWDYYSNKYSHYSELIKTHKKLSDNIWFAGGAWTWMGFAPNNDFTKKTMKPAMKACREHCIKNVFITMWGDNGGECSFYSVLPSLFAIRKFYDGVENMKEIKTEFKQITGEDFDRMIAMDLPNRVGGNRNPYCPVCKGLFYSDPFLGFLDASFVEGITEEFKKYSRRLQKYSKEGQFGYIYETLAKLCDFLSVKYDLGVNVRKAYTSGDKQGLEECVEQIKVAEKKLEKFYIAFRRYWFVENKPHGFDVQDQRIGGLKLRLRSCRERLIAYIAGEISSIPECEEKLLDVFGKGENISHGVDGWNHWITNVTTNIM